MRAVVAGRWLRCAVSVALVACLASAAGPRDPTLTTASGQPAGALPAAYSLRTPAAAMTATQCSAKPATCLDVTSVGAVPDGRTDDLRAFQGALARMGQVRGTVFVPAGTYLLSATLRVPAGVTLAGAGLTATTLLLSWADLANFRYGFLIAPTATPQVLPEIVGTTVRDLTVDGGRRASGCGDGRADPRCPPNAGGGIKPGTGWTVRQVRFTDLNYFKLWICGVASVRVLDNRFDNLDGATSSGNDNLGGGCGATNLILRGNSFASSIMGNVINLVRASHVTVDGNISRKGSIIFEGVSDSSVTGSTLIGGSLNLKSNAAYASSRASGNVNPRRIVVSENAIFDSPDWGINLVYRHRADTVNTPGGGNVIARNRVVRAGAVGIVISGDAAAKSASDSINGNVLVDVNMSGAGGYNTGCATFDPVAIALSVGTGDQITANTVTDDRSTPMTAYGISLGAREADHIPARTRISGNRVTGIAGSTVY